MGPEQSWHPIQLIIVDTSRFNGDFNELFNGIFIEANSHLGL